MADKLGKLSAEGMKVDDVFPMGISSTMPTASRFGGTPDQIADVVKVIPTVQPKAIPKFPRGIIAPDRSRVHVQLQRG